MTKSIIRKFQTAALHNGGMVHKKLLDLLNLCIWAELLEDTEEDGNLFVEQYELAKNNPNLSYELSADELNYFNKKDDVVKMYLRRQLSTLVIDEAKGIIIDTVYPKMQTLWIALGGVKEEYDETLNFVTSRIQATIKRDAIWQNLYLLSIADGKLTGDEKDFLMQMADELNVSQASIDFIVKNAHRLEFVVPEEGEQKDNMLRIAVEMLLVDGELAEDEYELALELTQKLGNTKADLDAMIKKVEAFFNQREATDHEKMEHNKSEVRRIFKDVDAIPVSKATFVNTAKTVLQSRDFSTQPYDNKTHNRTFYEYMWLILCRHMSINQKMIVLYPMHIDMIQNNENYWIDLKDYVLMVESVHGLEYPAIDLKNATMDFLKSQLELMWKK